MPADISVAGFDDIPEAAYFTPPLTTVRQRFDEVGRQALLALLAQLDGEARTGRPDDDRARAHRPRQHRAAYGVVVERVNVSVLLYVPVRSASLAAIDCRNCSVTASLLIGPS